MEALRCARQSSEWFPSPALQSSGLGSSFLRGICTHLIQGKPDIACQHYPSLSVLKIAPLSVLNSAWFLPQKHDSASTTCASQGGESFAKQIHRVEMSEVTQHPYLPPSLVCLTRFPPRYPPTHLPAHSLARPLTYILGRSLACTLPPLLTLSLTHSLTHPPTHPLTHPLTHSLTHHSLTHSLTACGNQYAAK